MPISLVLVLGTFNDTSTRAATVVFVLYAVKLGAPPAAVGVLASMFSLCPMLFAVQAGRLADRFGARWLIIAGCAASSAGSAAAYFFPTLPAVFIAAALMGLQSATCNVSLQNLVGQLSTSKTRARNFSNYSLVTAVSNLIGPLIAGYSIDHFGHGLSCVAVALMSFAPLLITVIWGRLLPGGTRHAGATAGSIMETLAAPGVRRMLINSSLFNTSSNLYLVYMPVYMVSVGLSASTIGIVLAVNAAAAMLVRLALPRLIDVLKEERLLAYAFYVGAAGLLLIPFFKSAAILGIISFVFGLSMGVCGPIVTMLMYTSSIKGRSGEGLGLKVTVNHFTKVVSPILFGALGSAFGLSPMFWINAAMMGTGGALSRTKK